MIKAYIPPLTLPTLAGLTPNHIDIELCDESVDDVNFNSDADLIGITGNSSQINRGYEIADAFRNKGKKVVMGGIHVSALPEEAKKHADSVVIGEAEDIWESIIRDFQHNQLKDTYKSGNYCDLKKLVIPRYDLLKLDRYRKSTGTNIPRLPIQATRGCPFNCHFCSVTKFWGPKIRKKPLENVEKELQNIESLGTNRVFFTDDNFIADVNYTRELLKIIKKKGFNFFCQVSTNIVHHEDIIAEMGKARCSGVLIGVETLSEENLADINKKFNKVADYEKMFSLFNRANVQVTTSLIMGLDNDTIKTMKDTMQTLKKFKVSYIQLHVLLLLPGTQMRDKYLIEKRIKDYNWDNQNGTTVTFEPKNLSAQDLQNYYWELYSDFYSFQSICKRILTISNLKLGLKTILVRLRTNLYYKTRLNNGLHPYAN